MQFIIIFIVIYGFFAWLGYRYKTNSNREAWLYAEKKIPLVLTSISTAATSIGGSATVLLGYMIYTHGWTGIVVDLPVGIGIFSLGYFFAEKIRKSNVNTVPEYLGLNYGNKVRKTSAIFIILTEMAWFGLLIKAFIMFIPVDILGNEKIIVILTGFFFLLYVHFSGQRGVYFTDLAQGLILIAGIIFLFIFSFLTEASPEMVSLNSEVLPLSLFDQAAFVIIMFLSGLTGPDILSRVFYARDSQNAKNGVMFGGAIKIFVTLVIAAIAYKSIHYMSGLDSAYRLFPEMINLFFLPPVNFLFQIIFLLIMVSSADTVIMTAITTLNNDILNKNHNLVSLKIIVWLLGATGIILALFFSTILDLMKSAYAFYAAGPALFVIYSIYEIKIKPFVALVIITISGATAIIITLAEPLQNYSILLSLCINIALLIIYKLYTRNE